MELPTTKRCSKCKQVKALNEYHPRQDRGGMSVESRCKVCRRTQHRAWYDKNRRNAHNIVPPPQKACWKCKAVKPTAAFGICRSYHDGLNPQCKACARAYAATIGNPTALLRDPHRRKSMMWTKYRLRPGQYLEMLRTQRHACAICEQEFRKTPYVDHDHKTGMIRGLLCHPCNTLLAAFDRDGFIERATNYLRQHALTTSASGGS